MRVIASGLASEVGVFSEEQNEASVAGASVSVDRDCIVR